MDRFSRFDFTIEKVTLRDKTCLVFRSGYFYQKNLTEQEIYELISFLKNTLENLHEVNSYVINKNNDIQCEISNHYLEKPKIKKVKKGHIYIAFCNRSKLYKIGLTSTDVTKRFKGLRTSNPDIELLCHFKNDDVVLTESWLHNLYKDKRVSGEWFDLNETDLERIKEILTKQENDSLI